MKRHVKLFNKSVYLFQTQFLCILTLQCYTTHSVAKVKTMAIREVAAKVPRQLFTLLYQRFAICQNKCVTKAHVYIKKYTRPSVKYQNLHNTTKLKCMITIGESITTSQTMTQLSFRVDSVHSVKQSSNVLTTRCKNSITNRGGTAQHSHSVHSRNSTSHCYNMQKKQLT